MTEEKKPHHRKKSEKEEKPSQPGPVPETDSELVEIPRSELEELRLRAGTDSEYREKMLRTLADMENLRKRLDRERKDYITYANQELLG